MAILAIIPARDAAAIKAKIEQQFPAEKRFQVTDTVTLVAHEGTANELAERLGIRAGVTDSGLVVQVSNYSGRANPDLWEWMKLNWETRPRWVPAGRRNAGPTPQHRTGARRTR